MGYRVLAIDDDAFIRTLIRNRLTEDGITVVEAKDSNEAFDVVWKEKFDLILLDIILPGMDGFAICNFLRKHQRTKDIPILFLSQRTDIHEKLHGFDIGGDDFITKPFDSKELSARVKHAIEKYRRTKAFENSVKEADCIREISLLLQDPYNKDETCSSLLTLLRQFFGIDMGVLYSIGEDPNLPKIEAMDGPVADYLPKLRKMLIRLHLSRQPAVINLQSIHHSNQIEINNESYQLPVSALGAPLTFKERTLGFIIFICDRNNNISSDNLEQLKRLLPYISMVVYSSKVYEESKKQISASISRLTSFYDITSALSYSVESSDVLALVVKSIKDLLNGDVASLMMLNKNGDLEIKYAEGLSREIIEKTRVKIGERIAGKVWATRQPVLLIDEGGETDIVKSSISIPLMVKDQIKGVLNVSKVSRYKFAKEEMDCLQHFAFLAAQAVEKTDLYRELKESYSELQKTLFNTILALSRAVEAKDGLTQCHIDRVTKYGLIMASMIDPDLVRDQNFLYSLMLHDVGKIKVPDNILNKPGPLTQEEFEIIKTHPAEGARIVEPVLGKCAYSVLYHHERYDGKGYPEGLSGQDIPLSARIIAVADVLDVMTSDRPYKKAKTFGEAVEELKRVAGTQLDPVIVSACLAAIEKGLIP